MSPTPPSRAPSALPYTTISLFPFRVRSAAATRDETQRKHRRVNIRGPGRGRGRGQGIRYVRKLSPSISADGDYPYPHFPFAFRCSPPPIRACAGTLIYIIKSHIYLSFPPLHKMPLYKSPLDRVNAVLDVVVVRLRPGLLREGGSLRITTRTSTEIGAAA